LRSALGHQNELYFIDMSLKALVLLGLLWATSLLVGYPVLAAPNSNIVVIMADDLDEASFNLLLNANLLPNIKQHLIDKGVRFVNSFVAESICCPSRVTMLTGKYSHNTGTYHVAGPESGLQGLVTKGLATTNGNTITSIDWLPSWLKTNGYFTGQVGKMMNTSPGGPDRKPGFDYWINVRDYDARPGMYRVFKDSDLAPIYPDVYMTKYIGDRGIEFINSFTNQSTLANFFLQLTPTSPHISSPFWVVENTGTLPANLANQPIAAYNSFDHPDTNILERRSVLVGNTPGQYEFWHSDLTSSGWSTWISDGSDLDLLPGTGNLPIVAFNSFVHPDTDGIRQHLIRGDETNNYTVYSREVTPLLTPWVTEGDANTVFPNTGSLPVVGFGVTNLDGTDLVQYLVRGNYTEGYELYTRARVQGTFSGWTKEPDLWELGTSEYPIEALDILYKGSGRLEMQLVTQGPNESIIYKQNVRSFYAPIPNVLGLTTGEVLSAEGEGELYAMAAAQLTGSPIIYPNLMWGARVWADGNWPAPSSSQTYSPGDYPGGRYPAGTLRTDGPNGFTPQSGFDLPGLTKSNFNNCAVHFYWICQNWPDVNSAVVGNRRQIDYIRRSHLDRLESLI
jgi:hypothetical protein